MASEIETEKRPIPPIQETRQQQVRHLGHLRTNATTVVMLPSSLLDCHNTFDGHIATRFDIYFSNVW
jgi:hypothetical protein